MKSTLILLNDSQIVDLSSYKEVIDVNEEAFKFKEGLEVTTPDRIMIKHGSNGVSLYKPSSIHNSGEKNNRKYLFYIIILYFMGV